MTDRTRPPRHFAAFRAASLVLLAAVVGAAGAWTAGSWEAVTAVADGIRPWLAGLVGIAS